MTQVIKKVEQTETEKADVKISELRKDEKRFHDAAVAELNKPMDLERSTKVADYLTSERTVMKERESLEKAATILKRADLVHAFLALVEIELDFHHELADGGSYLFAKQSFHKENELGKFMRNYSLTLTRSDTTPKP